MRTLLLLRGAPGSGKSTWIRENNLEKYALEADRFRQLISNPIMTTDGEYRITQDSDRFAWDMLYKALEQRMRRGDFTIIDATHATKTSMQNYKKLIEQYRYRVYYKTVDCSLKELLKRNKTRPEHKRVPEDAILQKHALLQTNDIPNNFEFDGIDIDSAFSNNVLEQLEITSPFFKRKEVIATFDDIPTLMRYIKEHDYDRDSEGLVLTDQNGFMFKVKYTYYREVKRLRGLHENAIKSLRTSTAIKLNKAFTAVQVRFLNWLRDKDNAYIFETHIIDIFRDFENDCGKQF